MHSFTQFLEQKNIEPLVSRAAFLMTENDINPYEFIDEWIIKEDFGDWFRDKWQNFTQNTRLGGMAQGVAQGVAAGWNNPEVKLNNAVKALQGLGLQMQQLGHESLSKHFGEIVKQLEQQRGQVRNLVGPAGMGYRAGHAAASTGATPVGSPAMATSTP